MTVYHQLQPVHASPYTFLQVIFGHEYPVSLAHEIIIAMVLLLSYVILEVQKFWYVLHLGIIIAMAFGHKGNQIYHIYSLGFFFLLFKDTLDSILKMLPIVIFFSSI